VARAHTMIDMAGMVLLQLEVPMAAVQAAIERAHAAHVPVLLNPAPAAPLPEDLWPKIEILVLNESEATAYAGLDVVDPNSAAQAGGLLRARGPDRVLVTLGAQGVVVVDGAGARHWPARKVKAVDTTAAGDTFIGALAAALCEGQSLDDAVALGQAAAAICVTRRGAQTSIPYRRQVMPATAGGNYP
jgi:ribokinase